MKIQLLIPIIVLGLAGSQVARAQDTLLRGPALEIAKKAVRSKTLLSWDQLGDLYQIALTDLTADDKSIKLKSTIYGIHKIFDPTINDSQGYASKALERYIEPYLNMNYQGHFDPANLTIGLNWAFIHANDPSQSVDLNKYNRPIMLRLTNVNQMTTPATQQILSVTDTTHRNQLYAELRKFSISGNIKDASAELKGYLGKAAIDTITAIAGTLDSLALAVNNRWNVTFSPQVTYAFNRSTVQGTSFLFNGVKGFSLATKQPKKSTQISLKAGFVLGSDSIVKRNAVSRQYILSQAGINQVIFLKEVVASDGIVSHVPSTEFAINGGYNYLTRGYGQAEDRGQPTLGAKLGFMIGKDSWLVFPFTYNFATKDSYATVSVKLNLGDPPFKSK